MTCFDYTVRLLLLFIVALGISVSDSRKAEAAPSNTMKEADVQLIEMTQECGVLLCQAVIFKDRNGLKKESYAAEFRKKKPSSRPNRHTGVRKKMRTRSQPLEQPQINHEFSHYGILKSPRRYDPSPNQKAGVVPNPKAKDLRLDHFQELDKNQDGVLDPLERATGRLDIDRDLSNRDWQ
jgi:hypothetical protein